MKSNQGVQFFKQKQFVIRERTLSMIEGRPEGFTNFSKKKKNQSPLDHRPKYSL